MRARDLLRRAWGSPHLLSRAFVVGAILASLVAAGLLLGARFRGALAGVRLSLADPLRPAALAVVLAIAGWLSSAGASRRFTAAGRTRLRVVLLAITLLLPVALGTIFDRILRAPETYPAYDEAVTSLYTLRAGRHLLLLGAYSRFSWHHPGPLLSDILAPLYFASGLREASHKWSAVLVNVASLVALFALLRRQAAALAALVALALASFALRATSLLYSSWNPLLPIYPLALAVIVAALVGRGQLTQLPLLLILTSFIVQCHVGYTLVAFALVMAALALYGVHSRVLGFVSWNGVSERRILNLSGWTLVVLWFLPLAEEVVNAPGNLSKLVTFMTSGQPHLARQSWTDAVAAWSTALVESWLPSFYVAFGDDYERTMSLWLVAAAIMLVALLVAGGIAATRRRTLFSSSFCWLSLVAVVVGFFSVHAIIGAIPHHVVMFFRWPVALPRLQPSGHGLSLIPLDSGCERTPGWSYRPWDCVSSPGVAWHCWNPRTSAKHGAWRSGACQTH
jgi:hypothetical protein